MYSDVILDLALHAGAVTLKYFRDQPEIISKSDGSPVTLADREAEVLLLEGLREHYPSVPVVAEEESERLGVPGEVGNRFFLVDPLDGTREFINGRADFTVNIAFIENGAPLFGVVYAPAKGFIYWTDGKTAWKGEVRDLDVVKREEIRVRQPGDTPVIVASRSHRSPETDAFCARIEPHRFISAGSSLKFCLVAEGAADLYPRFGPTMEWDTAAGDAILRAAGGQVVTFDGAPLRYGKAGEGKGAFLNPHFLAAGHLDLDLILS